MIPLLTTLLAETAAALAIAVIKPHAEELDERIAELLARGLYARRQMQDIEGQAKENLQKALEDILRVAQSRIRVAPDAPKED